MTELAERVAETKQCPICSQDLLLTEYGTCRSRKDGRNLYCKSCIRKKVSESRRAFKAYKSVRHQYVVQRSDHSGKPDSEANVTSSRRPYVTRQISKMTPSERVREAIKNGARSQKEIAQATRLGKDEIGDALANLLLWTREIKTEVVDNNRQYFINDATPGFVIYPLETSTTKVPRRKRDVPSSFSAVPDLMPGKKSPAKKAEAETEKPPGWVAA
jgi:hypothetical protein